MLCIFHKWGKWDNYTLRLPARQISKNYMLSPAIEYGQARVCERCNKLQRVMDRIVCTEETRWLMTADIPRT